MDKQLISTLQTEFNKLSNTLENSNIEYWFARDLQKILGYNSWDKFQNVITKAKIAVVTSGGIVPQGNPDRIESSSATKYGVYSIDDMDTMLPEDFMTIHGGYDRAFVLKNPNLVVPLDVLRDMEKKGEIGELADYFISTTGTGTSTGNAKAFGESFTKL